MAQENNERIRSDIRAIIKLMMGEKDRWNEQIHTLLPIDMPVGMEREYAVFQALEHCSIQNMPPTSETVIRLLEMNQRIPEPRPFIETIIEENKDDSFGLPTLSNFVWMVAQENRAKNKVNLMQQIVNDPTMDMREKYETMLSMVMDLAPSDNFQYEEMSEKDFIALTFKHNQRVIKLRNEGKAIGPQFPFKAMEAYFGALHWGEVSLLMGGTGTGKTTIAQHFEENVAWRQKLKCDVAHFSLETPDIILSIRQFCRYNNIPFNRVDEGYIDLGKGEWKERWDAWEKRIGAKTADNGYIRYWYSPEASVNDICAAMIKTSEVSEALGHSIIFIVDHLHSIDWQRSYPRMGEYEAQRAIFIKLSGVANRISKRVQNHLMVFAQEGDERGQVFGGKYAAKRSQYVFRVSRERWGAESNGEMPVAQESLPVTFQQEQIPLKIRQGPNFSKLFVPIKGSAGKYAAMDAEGNPRFWYKKGEEYKHTGAITITKGNDNALGIVRTMYEASMSIIAQDPAQIAQMRKDNLLPPEQVKGA